MAGESRARRLVGMKALTTMLAERAMEKMEQPVDGLKEWRDAAQAQVSEPVIDACLFSRPTSYAGNVDVEPLGPDRRDAAAQEPRDPRRRAAAALHARRDRSRGRRARAQ